MYLAALPPLILLMTLGWDFSYMLSITWQLWLESSKDSTGLDIQDGLLTHTSCTFSLTWLKKLGAPQSSLCLSMHLLYMASLAFFTAWWSESSQISYTVTGFSRASILRGPGRSCRVFWCPHWMVPECQSPILHYSGQSH